MPQQRQPFDSEVLPSRTIQRWPIVPPWARNRAEFRSLVIWLVKYGAHATGYHLRHSPLYAARLLARSRWGLAKVAVGSARWVLDRSRTPSGRMR
jgi:S-DNA-T family DNA segregation ATPase FtsK/SpoIIIE